MKCRRHYFYYKIENGNKKTILYTYHLFDDTSRGLNNVYNVLNEIVHKRNRGKKCDLQEKKQLLDTIVSSKLIYNTHRNEIQKNIILIAESEIGCKVFFDNAKAIIYGENCFPKDELNQEKGTGYQLDNCNIKNPIDRFALFILVDFAARLLYEEEKFQIISKMDENYRDLKKIAMIDLVLHPIIAEKVMEPSIDSWKYKKPQVHFWMRLYDVYVSFLLKADLIFNLAFYKENTNESSLKKMMELFGAKESGIGIDMSDINMRQSSIIAFWRTIVLIASANDESTNVVLDRYYHLLWREYEYMKAQLSDSHTQNVVMRLFEKECIEVSKKPDSLLGDWWKREQEEERERRILLNTISKLLKKEGEDKIDEAWKEISEKENMEKIEILKVICEEKLWEEDVASGVIDYMNKEIINFLAAIIKKIENKNMEWKIETKEANDSWLYFLNSEDGVSMTKAKETKYAINEILNNVGESLQTGISYDTYKKIIIEGNKLANNTYVKYGRYEVSKFLSVMQRAFVHVPDAPNWEYFTFLLQCSYKYKETKGLTQNAMENAQLLKEIMEALEVSHKNEDMRALDKFMEKLNQNLTHKVTSDVFEKMFKSYTQIE